MEVIERANPLLGEPLTVFLRLASDPDLTASLRQGRARRTPNHPPLPASGTEMGGRGGNKQPCDCKSAF